MTQYSQLEQFSLWAAAKNGQPFDPDTLESAVNDLLKMATQKTAGQRKGDRGDLSWDNLERVRMAILSKPRRTVCIRCAERGQLGRG